MSVYAKIKNGNEVIKEMLVQDIMAVAAWLEKHHGEYDDYEIKHCKTNEIKQGREP